MPLSPVLHHSRMRKQKPLPIHTRLPRDIENIVLPENILNLLRMHITVPTLIAQSVTIRLVIIRHIVIPQQQVHITFPLRKPADLLEIPDGILLRDPLEIVRIHVVP